MLPKLAGIIARRVLLNFWADPEVVRRLVPEPLEVATHNGSAVVDICLIRLERLRLKGMPAPMGISAENMAHRVAIRYPSEQGMKDGVFIWRRETDCEFLVQLGGCLFPGVHHRAEFDMTENESGLAFDVRTEQHETDVSFRASYLSGWQGTMLFPTFDDVWDFFERGDCSFSYAKRHRGLERLRLRALTWEMTPLGASDVQASFYENPAYFPAGSVGFDGACLMRSIPHEWDELASVAELAGVAGARLRSAAVLVGSDR